MRAIVHEFLSEVLRHYTDVRTIIQVILYFHHYILSLCFCWSFYNQTQEYQAMLQGFDLAMMKPVNQGEARSEDRKQVCTNSEATQGKVLYDILRDLRRYKKENAKYVRYFDWMRQSSFAEYFL